MFKDYSLAENYDQDGQGSRPLVLELSVPQYVFKKFKATVTIKAIAYGPGRKILFEQEYTEQGKSQGSKMFNAGAFGMKSAVRQSSFDAYKKIFVLLRDDLNKIVAG